jgi:hypothetical protein
MAAGLGHYRFGSCTRWRCIRNMPLCVNVKTETEMHHSFCVVHRYRGAAAGFRLGSHHELLAHAGRRGAG